MKNTIKLKTSTKIILKWTHTNDKNGQVHLSKKINPIALRTAKTLWSFGCSECNRVKGGNIETSPYKTYLPLVALSTMKYCQL